MDFLELMGSRILCDLDHMYTFDHSTTTVVDYCRFPYPIDQHNSRKWGSTFDRVCIDLLVGMTKRDIPLKVDSILAEQGHNHKLDSTVQARVVEYNPLDKLSTVHV